MTVIPRVAYIDVDDTIVRSVGTKRIPIPTTIRFVRKLSREGWQLFCWSSGGADYARDSAREFEVEDSFIAFLPKPHLIIDDVSPLDWRDLKVQHPAEIPDSV